MDETIEQKIDNLEDGGIREAAAVLELFLEVCSPVNKRAMPDDTAFTVIFELLFELASPVGLMANLASIISVADRWRYDTLLGATIPDVWWVLTFNSMALGMGCIANIVLLLQIRLWIARAMSMAITMTCYLGAVLLYLSLLAACEYKYFGTQRDMQRTNGYWQAVCATVLYFFALLALVLHMWYFRARNLNQIVSHRQHQLMILCILYTAWLAIGAGAFQAKTMIDTSYAEAVYYVVVSYLTLGYGDVVPRTVLGQALSIPFIYGGLILGGLVTISVFQATLNYAHSKSISNGARKDREELLSKWTASGANDKESHVSDRQSFDAMRAIVNNRQTRQAIVRAAITVTWLTIFWLIGALIFKFTEKWAYFSAFYMCAISLASVGYGDFVPQSSSGRSILIHWSLMALPTMSAAVSGITSVVVLLLSRNSSFAIAFTNLFHGGKRVENAKLRGRLHSHHTFSRRLTPNAETWHSFLQVVSSKDGSKFDYDLWNRIICALFCTDKLLPDFWISDFSPIRVPFLDEKRMLTMLILHIMRMEDRGDGYDEQETTNYTDDAANATSQFTRSSVSSTGA